MNEMEKGPFGISHGKWDKLDSETIREFEESINEVKKNCWSEQK